MKTQSQSSRRHGFTLVELLVVIAIVAVLAGLSFAAVNSGLKKARETEAKVMASSLEQAVNAFYGEYNRLPEVNQPEIDTNSQAGIDLITTLLGQEDEQERDNARSIRFLDVKEGKGRRNGLIYNQNNQVEGLYDPFGNPFTIVMNIDYEDELQFNYGGRQYELRGKQVAVYSPGADEEPGTTDDITTFNR